MVDRPKPILTSRLLLRPPRPDDARAIFDAYAADAEVTRFVGWPRHASIDDTHAFLESSDAEWARWPAGPLIIESRTTGEILGSTGLSFETSYRAATGYVLAQRFWKHGYATEALAAMVALASQLSVQRVYALCHAGHDASARVLERRGFALEGILRKHLVFPNLDDQEPQDVRCYARTFANRE